MITCCCSACTAGLESGCKSTTSALFSRCPNHPGHHVRNVPYVARELVPPCSSWATTKRKRHYLGAGGWITFFRVTLPKFAGASSTGHSLQCPRDGRIWCSIGRIRPHPGPDNTMPLHIEILYNEYNFVGAFAVLTAHLAGGCDARVKNAGVNERATDGDIDSMLERIREIWASCAGSRKDEPRMVDGRHPRCHRLLVAAASRTPPPNAPRSRRRSRQVPSPASRRNGPRRPTKNAEMHSHQLNTRRAPHPSELLR